MKKVLKVIGIIAAVAGAIFGVLCNSEKIC